MTSPVVSCVMIFLDGERFLDEAIRSVVEQVGYDDWELVLVDDGSTDESTAIAQRWAGSDPGRIRYLEHPDHANLGMSASRNAGVAAARGRYVGFLDCDDVWLPFMLAHCARVLEAHPDAAVIIGRTWYWHGWTRDEADSALDHVDKLPACAPRTTIDPPELLAAIYGVPDEWRVPAICSLLIRRDALMGIGGLEADFPGLYEDQVLYTKLAMHLPAVVDPRPLALYRQHAASASSASIAAGTWRRDGPSEPERRFLEWMLEYVESETGADSIEAGIVRRNLEHAEQWVETPRADEAVPSWLRRHSPQWARLLVRRARRIGRQRPPTSILAEWSEQFLRAAIATMHGSILVVAATGRSTELWVDELPPDCAAAGAALECHPWRAAVACEAAFDHVVAPLGATSEVGVDRLFADLPALLRPGGSAALLLTAGSSMAVDAIRERLAEAHVTIETFGNACTKRAVAEGVPASALGAALDRHDPAVPVTVAVTIVRGA